MNSWILVAGLILQEAEPAEQPVRKQDPELQQKLEDLERLILDVEERLKEMERRLAQVTSANPLNVLNPTLTVIGNSLYRRDDREVFLDGDPSQPRIDDQLNVREVELDLRAAVDPFVDGIAILSLESEVSGEFETGVEEFFLKIKSLPIPGWEEPPLGTLIKLGRMRTEFGTNNLLHLHDLPQSNRPLVIEEFLGEEGHIANGISARMFLPSPGSTALQLTLQALQGGSAEVAQDGDHPAYLGNLHLFLPLGSAHSLDASLIGFYGTNDAAGRDQSRVGSFDWWYRWKPLRQGEWKSLLMGGQLFAAEHEFPVDPADPSLGSEREEPLGYTLWTQYQLARNLYLGARWDRTDFLRDDSQEHERVQP
ncbi:MAG: hypothetical protein HY509_02010, partial [Acidobacteria bacterium]|nr:hypothetical protein [Acidobacteriota bacterium]